MNRILVTILALIAIALIWMLVRIDAPPRDAVANQPMASSERSGASGARLATEGKSGGDRARADLAERAVAEPSPALSGAPWVRVVSSTGLALASVELEVEPRSWQRRDLVDGACALDRVHVPCGVRAPGHVAATVEKPGSVVTLEPDALLELDGEHLKECVPAIGLFENWANNGTPGAVRAQQMVAAISTSGFVDDKRWLVAVDADRIGRFPGDDEAEIDLEWRDHRTAIVVLTAVRGVRAQWDVPCEDVAETAPLDIAFTRPESASSGEIEASLTNASTIVEEPAITTTDWGRVQMNPRSLTSVDAHVARGESGAHWDGIPLGRRFLVRARDLESGAFDCMTFTHDGTARTMKLRPGLVLAGRVAVPEGTPLPTRAFVFWAAAGGAWMGQGNAALDASGRFELHGWSRLPANGDCGTVPSKLQVTLRCEGFDWSTTYHDVDTNGRCDCGDIQLQPMVAQLVLAPGHGIADSSIDHKSLRISTRPDRVFIDVSGRSLPDGSFALYLHAEKRAKKGADAATPDAFWASGASAGIPLHTSPDEVVPALLLDLDEGEGLAFRRADDGRYERVRDREHSVDFECSALPQSGGRWTFGWSWLGMRQRVDSLGADALEERRRITFRAPDTGVSVWWSTADGATMSATEGGTIDLGNDATTTIHVP